MIRAWHFVGPTLRDGSPIPADGEWLEFAGKCVICESGLHASREPFDALQYAPGATLCLVECDQIVVEQADKFVCHRRRIVARKDVTEILRWFARQRALSVVHLWDGNPPEVVLDWLMTGDEKLREVAREAAWAAREAACAAASEATREAAWAACAAASEAAREAAWAAREAASEAASAAAWAAREAAREAASEAARAEFNSLIYAEFSEFL